MDPQFKLVYCVAVGLTVVTLVVSLYLSSQGPLDEAQKTLFTTTLNAFWACVGFLLGGYAGQRKGTRR